MAKQTLPVDFQDDILESSMGGKRRYNLINNPDGTVSLEDVTDYTQVGSNFGAAQMNATNQAVNESADKANIIDVLGLILSNTEEGKIAGALAIKNFYANAAKTANVIDNLNDILANVTAGKIAGALALKELNNKAFMCDFTQIDTTAGTSWMATDAGNTRSLVQPITNFKMIGFLVIEGGSDGNTHRQIQWFPVAWMKNIIDGEGAINRKILFNYTRSETGRRVWVAMNSGSYTNFTFSKAAASGDAYSLTVFGLK